MAKTPEIKANAVIFAGGVGTRMWPVSRKSWPKQFEKIINGKSTIQLTVDHLRPEFSYENIFVSTNVKYKDIIRKQLSSVPRENIIGEPERRDVAPAVGYLMAIFEKLGDRPTVILWSDHIRRNLPIFKNVLKTGVEFINKNPNKFLFVGEKPRFANQNLGWIEAGKFLKTENNLKIYQFKNLKYRPDLSLAQKFFKSGKSFWNPGYWVVKPSFVLEQYKRFKPEMYKKFIKLAQTFGKKNHKEELEKIYPTLEKISFDNAILEKLEPEKGVVVAADMGWSDVGTWQALKEALQKNQKDNLTNGNVYAHKSENNILYNYTPQLIAAVGVKNLVVVATKDVILVADQESMKQIKEVVEIFEKDKKLNKYI